MSSKLVSSPQTHNILQPKRLNSNGVPAGCSTGGGTGSAGVENHYCHGLTGFAAKEDPASASPTKPSSTGNQINHDLGLFPMSGSRLTGLEVKRVFGSTGSGKKGVVTMAKRNARERNRVKQVNQGFQTLRQHIPESYRLKKMSKVDTLRCALEYIRSLEEVLDEFPAEFQAQDQNQDFSSTTQHLDRNGCTSSLHHSVTDMTEDQSQSFSFSSEHSEDEENGSYLQLSNTEMVDADQNNSEHGFIKLEHDGEQFVPVINMLSMISAESMSVKMSPSNSTSPVQPSISVHALELKLFGAEALNEN